MSDLREKLKALAQDWERKAQDNLDNSPHGSPMVAASYLDRASELRDLLASHEEREGDVCSACAGTGKPISGKLCICGGAGTLLAEANGLRRALYDADEELTRLRSHTDREPDGWTLEWRFRDLPNRQWTLLDSHQSYRLNGVEGGTVRIFPTREDAEKVGTRQGYESRPRPVYIGPPVQPEEEENV